MPESDKFWMIYGWDKSAPSRRHTTYEEAAAEAEKLVELNPRVTFYVLEAVAFVRTPRQPIETVRI